MGDPRSTEHPTTSAVPPDQPAVPPDPSATDKLDEEEDESFPASDPHSDWAGPAT